MRLPTIRQSNYNVNYNVNVNVKKQKKRNQRPRNNNHHLHQKQTKLKILFLILTINSIIYNGIVQNDVHINESDTTSRGILPTIATLKTIMMSKEQEQQEQQHSRHPQEQHQQDLDQLNIPLCLLPNNTDRIIKCRIDEIGQFLESKSKLSSESNSELDFSDFTSIFHEPVQSMPTKRRIPIRMANNDTYIKRAHTDYPDDQQNLNADSYSAVVEYNPVIIPLYTKKRKRIKRKRKRNSNNDGKYEQEQEQNYDYELISDLDSKLLYDITGGNNDVYYILYQRSANHHDCGDSIRYNFTIDKGWKVVNYITFTLLDKTLQPITGNDSSVVIDTHKYFFGNKNYNNRIQDGFFQDFTFFAARTTLSNPKKDHFFILSNGSYLLPISIKRLFNRQNNNGSGSGTTSSSSKINLLPLSGDSIISGGGGEDDSDSSLLEIRIIHGPLTTNMPQIELRKAMIASRAKNLHIFESSSSSSSSSGGSKSNSGNSNGNGNTYTEYWPMNNPKRTIQRINLFSNDFTKFHSLNYHKNQNLFLKSNNTTNNNETITSSSPNSYNETTSSSSNTNNNPLLQSKLPSKLIPTSQLESYDTSYRGVLKHPPTRGTACCIDMILTLPVPVPVPVPVTTTTTKNNYTMNTSRPNTTTSKSEQQQQQNRNSNSNNKVRRIHVKVGISHSVERRKRDYLHQLYAFDPNDEHNGFPIIAYSGLFCLSGIQKDKDIGRYDKHWITHRSNSDDESISDKKQFIDDNNIVYNCPKITFATGIAEYLGNDSKIADTDTDSDEYDSDEYEDEDEDEDDNNNNNDGHVIISYGVDDCYSRSIIVSKQKIELLLLGSHYQGYSE